MDDSGWKPVIQKKESFVIRRKFSDTDYKILISDFVRLWCVESTVAELLEESKKENPLCEFNDTAKALKLIFKCFDEALKILELGDVNGNQRNLILSTKLEHMPFRLEWTLTEQSPNDLFIEVTEPMLKAVFEFSSRQNYLCRELIKKDKVISEYKLVNGPLAWCRVETEEFDEKEFKDEKWPTSSYEDQDLIECACDENLLNYWNRSVCREREVKKKEITPDSFLSSTSPGKAEVVEENQSNVDTKSIKSEGLEIAGEKPVTQPSVSQCSKRRRKVKLNL